jgi:hypothetical protein
MFRREDVKVSDQTQALLQGPLKHVKAAALAAALLPLASVAASPAVAQEVCSGGAIGDYVWEDANSNGVQDPGELPFRGAVVSLMGPGIAGSLVTGTDDFGYYLFFDLCAGTYTVAVQIPPEYQPSPANQGGDDSRDSDGEPDVSGTHSVASVTLTFDAEHNDTVDFGFVRTVDQPGTGTPGYWKNHPEAWPVAQITVGGRLYTRDQAIAVLWQSGSDKTLTMFSSLVPAMLNVLIGNEPSCVEATITAGNNWLASYPVGSNVRASSVAWKLGEPIHRHLDNYNNGMLCAPHRD